MSEADPDVAMLARLAALDRSAAEHVHGRLVAADDSAEISDLGRTYQRLSRCVRQTLGLKAISRRPTSQMTEPPLARRLGSSTAVQSGT